MQAFREQFEKSHCNGDGAREIATYIVSWSGAEIQMSHSVNLMGTHSVTGIKYE